MTIFSDWKRDHWYGVPYLAFTPTTTHLPATLGDPLDMQNREGAVHTIDEDKLTLTVPSPPVSSANPPGQYSTFTTFIPLTCDLKPDVAEVIYFNLTLAPTLLGGYYPTNTQCAFGWFDAIVPATPPTVNVVGLEGVTFRTNGLGDDNVRISRVYSNPAGTVTLDTGGTYPNVGVNEFALVRDPDMGTAGGIRLYVDGELVYTYNLNTNATLPLRPYVSLVSVQDNPMDSVVTLVTSPQYALSFAQPVSIENVDSTEKFPESPFTGEPSFRLMEIVNSPLPSVVGGHPVRNGDVLILNKASEVRGVVHPRDAYKDSVQDKMVDDLTGIYDATITHTPPYHDGTGVRRVALNFWLDPFLTYRSAHALSADRLTIVTPYNNYTSIPYASTGPVFTPALIADGGVSFRIVGSSTDMGFRLVSKMGYVRIYLEGNNLSLNTGVNSTSSYVTTRTITLPSFFTTAYVAGDAIRVTYTGTTLTLLNETKSLTVSDLDVSAVEVPRDGVSLELHGSPASAGSERLGLLAPTANTLEVSESRIDRGIIPDDYSIPSAAGKFITFSGLTIPVRWRDKMLTNGSIGIVGKNGKLVDVIGDIDFLSEFN